MERGKWKKITVQYTKVRDFEQWEGMCEKRVSS